MAQLDLKKKESAKFYPQFTVVLTANVNLSRVSLKLMLTQPHIVENRGISMAPLVLRLIS